MSILEPDFKAAFTEKSMSVSDVLSRGIDVVGGLNDKLINLDRIMVTGRAADIANAAAEVEQVMRDASPTFSLIAETMKVIGANSLDAAAIQLRIADDNGAASLAEALRAALSNFSRKSQSAKRRASQFSHGLNISLRSLQALGVQDCGRLIAEA